MSEHELPASEIAGRSAWECVKVAVARKLRMGHHDGPFTVDVSPGRWESVATELEYGNRYYRFEGSGSLVVIVVAALGRDVRVAADPRVSDETFRVL